MFARRISNRTERPWTSSSHEERPTAAHNASHDSTPISREEAALIQQLLEDHRPPGARRARSPIPGAAAEAEAEAAGWETSDSEDAHEYGDYNFDSDDGEVGYWGGGGSRDFWEEPFYRPQFRVRRLTGRELERNFPVRDYAAVRAERLAAKRAKEESGSEESAIGEPGTEPDSRRESMHSARSASDSKEDNWEDVESEDQKDEGGFTDTTPVTRQLAAESEDELQCAVCQQVFGQEEDDDDDDDDESSGAWRALRSRLARVVALRRRQQRVAVRELACGHIFHDACVAEWLLKCQACCPMCRCDLTVGLKKWYAL